MCTSILRSLNHRGTYSWWYYSMAVLRCWINWFAYLCMVLFLSLTSKRCSCKISYSYRTFNMYLKASQAFFCFRNNIICPWTTHILKIYPSDLIIVLNYILYFIEIYHLQAWYISIIPPNMWLSLPEDKSREHRNVKYYYFNHILFLDMVFSHLPLYFWKIPRHVKWRGKNTMVKKKLEKIIIFAEK